VLDKLKLMLLLVTVLILGAAALSASTTLTALVLERRSEIGTMKAIGAADSKLVRLFLTELGIMGLVGGLGGYLIGLVAAQTISQSLFSSSVTPRMPVFFIVIAISLIVSVVSGLIPIRKIRAVEPALVLRGE
jgi:putative ABC transport system permease protein